MSIALNENPSGDRGPEIQPMQKDLICNMIVSKFQYPSRECNEIEQPQTHPHL